MTVREITKPVAGEFDVLVTLLTDAFWRTPMFSGYLFRGRKPLARTFMAMLLRYGLKAGRVFAADGEGGIVACATWATPASPEMTLQTYLRLGLWPYIAWIGLRSPAALARCHELFHMLEAHAPETPCATLEFLASRQKGAGERVARESMAAFAGQTLYVESIVSKDDHAFYRRLGFVPFARTDFHGTDYAFMLIRPSDGRAA
jgi:hypothetical protein